MSTITNPHMNNSFAYDEESIPLGVQITRYTTVVLWSAIVVFGLAGNSLTIFVLTRKKLRDNSTSVYLIALASYDIAYIICSLLMHVVDLMSYFPDGLRGTDTVYCSISVFLTRTLSHLSVWTLSAVTVERAIWVVRPFEAKKICTRKVAGIVLIVLIFVALLLNHCFLYSLEIETDINMPRSCKPRFPKLTKSLAYTDLALASALPFIIMIVCNCLIIFKLRMVAKKAHGETKMMDDRRRRTAWLTNMLLYITFFFVISITPLLIYNIVYETTQFYFLRPTTAYAIEKSVYTIWYLNFSIHFLLYCLSGPKFRATALELCSQSRDRKNDATQHGDLRCSLIRPSHSQPGDPKSIAFSSDANHDLLHEQQ